MKNIKCITIIAKEWFDRVNGNSYFSARVFINNDSENPVILPFQYGYGDHYKDMAGSKLNDLGITKLKKYDSGGRESLWRYCDDNNINLICTKHENCLKRDVKWYGEE